jgi:hypothetical protein
MCSWTTAALERLWAVDPTEHFYRYTIKSTPMWVTDYERSRDLVEQARSSATVHGYARIERRATAELSALI